VKKQAPATSQTDLFDGARRQWTDAQLAELGLSPGDAEYENAKQAADQGWPAGNIRLLLWPALGRDAL